MKKDKLIIPSLFCNEKTDKYLQEIKQLFLIESQGANYSIPLAISM